MGKLGLNENRGVGGREWIQKNNRVVFKKYYPGNLLCLSSILISLESINFAGCARVCARVVCARDVCARVVCAGVVFAGVVCAGVVCAGVVCAGVVCA